MVEEAVYLRATRKQGGEGGEERGRGDIYKIESSKACIQWPTLSDQAVRVSFDRI